jgi:hypothetical protein
VVPDTAWIVVDGTALAPGEHSVDRPGKGHAVSVVLRAPGYEDTTLAIDDASPATLDVTLRSKNAPVAPLAPATTTAAPPAYPFPQWAPPSAATKPPALPANPN